MNDSQQRLFFRYGHLVGLVVVASCVGCNKKVEVTKESPRPVSVLELRKLDPTRRLQLTGAVQSWKEEDIGFEVRGRVDWIIREGEEVEGRTYDENGKLLTEGTVLARLDNERHSLAVDSVAADLKANQADAEATRIEIEEVLPAQLKASIAEMKRAAAEFEREKGLLAKEAGTKTDYDRAEADYLTADARVDQTKASISSKRADLGRMQARVKQAEEALKGAKLDLRDCDLYSPFEGRVADVLIISGAFADPGRPVVRVVVMDPIKIEVAVSAATDRMVAVGDIVQVYPPGMDRPEDGWVYTKQTVADPNTRTFGLSIMVRNRQVPVDYPQDADFGDLPQVMELHRCHRLYIRKGSPYAVFSEAVLTDDKGPYVWKAVGTEHGQAPEDRNPILTVRKVRIGLGDRRRSILGRVLRELTDMGELTPRDMLIADPPEGLKSGDKVVFMRKRWLFRPGDVAGVLIGARRYDAGFYVPMDAVKPIDDERGNVFIVQDGRAKQVKVRLSGYIDDSVQIKAEDSEGTGLLKEGALLINSNVHFLVPDEPVAVAKKERASL